MGEDANGGYKLPGNQDDESGCESVEGGVFAAEPRREEGEEDDDAEGGGEAEPGHEC